MSNRKLFSNCLRRALQEPRQRCLLVVEGKTERSISYRNIADASLAVREALIENNIPKGTIIPIVLGHSEWVLTSFIGCVLHGCCPTLLPPLTSKQDPVIFHSSFEKLLHRLEASLIITRRSVEDSIPERNHSRLKTEDIELSEYSDDEILNILNKYEAEESDVAFLQHSSGTTGLKKGVMLSHQQVLTQIDLYAETIQLTEKENIASWLPLYHDMGLICSFLMPLEIGCSVTMISPQEWVVRPTMLLDYIEKEQASFAWIPNFAFHHISRFDRRFQKRNLSHLRALISCSEPCRRETFELFFEKYKVVGLKAQALQVSYAMAENVFAVTQTDLNADFRTSTAKNTDGYVSCGKALSDIKIEILDLETQKALPDGELSEIAVRSSCLFSGYHKQPELSTKKISDGAHYTSSSWENLKWRALCSGKN